MTKADMSGRFVTSKAGHDKGKLYVIAAYDDRYVYLVDGEYKKMDAPKKKSLRHVQMTNETVEEELRHGMRDGKAHLDEAVRYAVKRKLNANKAE